MIWLFFTIWFLFALCIGWFIIGPLTSGKPIFTKPGKTERYWPFNGI
jgi:hypothetical protein